MRVREPALALSTAVATTAAVLAFAAPQAAWLRVPLGLPLVLLLPGYGLARTLFPHGALGRLERMMVALGLSIALVIFLGFVLGTSAEGLGRASWMIALAAVTLLGNAAAFVRDGRSAADRRGPLPLPPPAYTALGALAAAALVLAMLVAASEAGKPASGQLLEFWALPASQTPTGEVSLGVRNAQSEWTDFHIVVTHADRKLADVWLDVPRGATRTLTVPMPRATKHPTPVRALLTGPAPRPTERIVLVWPSETPTPTPAGKAR